MILNSLLASATSGVGTSRALEVPFDIGLPRDKGYVIEIMNLLQGSACIKSR